MTGWSSCGQLVVIKQLGDHYVELIVDWYHLEGSEAKVGTLALSIADPLLRVSKYGNPNNFFEKLRTGN